MKIELAKLPVKIGEEVTQRDYVVITMDGNILSLPLDPDYDTEEYKKTFNNFFTSVNENIEANKSEEAKETNE
jgi:hypothetical protein